MRTSDELFQLIRSLTKPEKRYFKLFTSIYGGEKNYLRLFDAIDAQESYDEEKLRETFKGNRFLRQLNVTKRYLYEQIMRSLRAYHEGEGARARVQELVRNIEILYEKGLLEQARKMYVSALELANEQEDFVMVMEVLRWQERMEPGSASSEEKIDRAFSSIGKAIDGFRDFIDHSIATRKIALSMLGGQPRTEEELASLETSRQLLPPSEENIRSVRATVLYNWSLATYHFARREYQQALASTDRQIELLEGHPRLIDANPLGYISAVSNQLTLLKRIGDFDSFWVVVDKLRRKAQEFMSRSQLWGPRIRADIFATVYLSQLGYHVSLRKRSGHEGLVEEIEQGLQAHEGYLVSTMPILFYNNLSLLYFDLGDYRKSLDYNLRIVQVDPPNRATSTYHHARLMNLVIHYELGNLDLLEYLVPAACRYFRTRDLMGRFESTVLDLFKRLIRAREDALPGLFQEARDRFAALLEDPLEADSFRSFQYFDWTVEKIAAMRGTMPAGRSIEAGGRRKGRVAA